MVQLKEQIVQMLLDRLADEYTAYYFYLCSGNWCNNVGYINVGKFFITESEHELEHARGIQEFLVSWNVQPVIPQVQTNVQPSGLIDIINNAYQLEYSLLQKYIEISKKCIVSDMNVFRFLQKYIEIQNDSVVEYSDLINTLELINTNNKFELLYFENEYFK